MKRANFLKPLAKLISYIFEHNPYEFGLIPDKEGYIKLKELIQAINDEDGWSHINKNHISELIYSFTPPPVEILDNLIRSKNPVKYNKPVYAEKLPGEIYTAIRNKAHFHVYHKGLKAAENDFIIMSSKKEVAEKIGKRKDQKTIIIVVNTAIAEEEGVFFYAAGETIFLSKTIPVKALNVPPLPEKKGHQASQGKAKSTKHPGENQTPGSYFPDIEKTKNNTSVKTKKRDKTSWKENKKKMRKEQHKLNSDY